MNNVYVEFSTRMLPVPAKRIIFRNMLVTLGVLLIVYAVIFYPILWTVGLVFLVLAYFYNRGNHFQYEYILLNDDLAIDKIINNLKRKKVYRGNLTYLDLFTNDSAKLEKYLNSGKRIRRKNFADKKEPIYYLVIRNENKLDILSVNADQELISAIRRRHPLQTQIIQIKKAVQS